MLSMADGPSDIHQVVVRISVVVWVTKMGVSESISVAVVSAVRALARLSDNQLHRLVRSSQLGREVASCGRPTRLSPFLALYIQFYLIGQPPSLCKRPPCSSFELDSEHNVSSCVSSGNPPSPPSATPVAPSFPQDLGSHQHSK